jgi:GTPase
MSLYPHYNMLVIDANIDTSSVQEKYYAIPQILKIPMFVVITKIDMIQGTARQKKDKLISLMAFIKKEL